MGKFGVFSSVTLFFSGIGLSNFYFSKKLIQHTEKRNDEIMREINSLKLSIGKTKAEKLLAQENARK